MYEAIYKNEYMSRLIRHIEDNLPSELDAGLLSRTGHVSHAQLYRDFYNMTGHSVKEYIRKRRLSNALALVKVSDFALSDIAYQCGYSSQQALCRTVKQVLGMTVLEYKNGDMYYFYPPYNSEPIQSVTVSSETVPEMICLRFYHSCIKNIENIAINIFLNAIPGYGGRILGRNGKQEGSRFCYELYLTDTNRDCTVLRKFGFIKLKNIPPFTSLFASSTVKNDESKISGAWNYLYHTWLQNSMFEYTNEPYYEEYILKNGKPAKLRLYLPIQKRKYETTIKLVSNPDLNFAVSAAKGYNAEKMAAKAVIDFLSEHYPYILNTSREFYLQKETCSCVCGVKVNSALQIKAGDDVFNMSTANVSYLVLTSSVMGDYFRYTDLLLTFASDNGIIANKKKIFAVYDARESFDKPKIKMYCPVKIETK
ncbi:MAG: AraC family transcriptional regulator [Clostridiales bacterium]|jgi:AraC-like DNA-binding protein|nr:AraC family transcriptional regulator [Clostridiales bacterium]